MNIYVARVNPLGTDHNSRAAMSRIITDKNVAKNIAEYIINQKKKVIFNKDDKFSSLRKQWTFVRMLTKQRTQLYNQLESILYIANPEMLIYSKHGYPNWLLAVIQNYPTAKRLSKARVTSLSSIPYLNEQKAVSLINKARASVAASDDVTANLVSSLVKQIIGLSKTIDKQSKFIADNCKLPEIQILKSFPSIDDYSDIGLLLNICSIYYQNTKNLASYFGIHPVWKQSGDGTWGMHMSKQGKKEVRNILYMVAKTAIFHNELTRELYAPQLKKGINKTVAAGVCMHKILRIIFGMLKHNEKFNPEKDRANSQKMLKDITQIKTVTNKLRRYQKLDLAAPILTRQIKKRKEQGKSQNEIISLSTISSPHSFKD
jgi:transposase